MGNDYVREIAALRRQLKVARLRSKNIAFTFQTPKVFRGNRTGTAYQSGYKAGWRGWKFDQPYSTNRHQRAYRQGYYDANSDLKVEAAETL